MFCTNSSHTSQLPPCRDTLRLHIYRANYQAAVWKRALDACAEIPTPVGHGWIADPDNPPSLAVHWSDQLPAPRALLEFVSCSCRCQCKSGRCSCVANSLKCSDACKCSINDCSNKPTESDRDGDQEGHSLDVDFPFDSDDDI